MRYCKLLMLLMLTVPFLFLISSCSPSGLKQQIIGGPQSAAKEVFEQWAQEGGTPYRDVRYQTLRDDGTYATVRIVGYFRPAAEAAWLEKEAEIECRKVGAEWQCDQWMFLPLPRGRQRERQKEIWSCWHTI